MPDREKVVGHLYDCLSSSKPENMWVFVRKSIVGDAIALLREQEPVKPILSVIVPGMYYCGECGAELLKTETGDKSYYCSYCGKKVQWDAD